MRTVTLQTFADRVFERYTGKDATAARVAGDRHERRALADVHTTCILWFQGTAGKQNGFVTLNLDRVRALAGSRHDIGFHKELFRHWNATVRELELDLQFEAIRRTAMVNMVDRRAVADLAKSGGHETLATMATKSDGTDYYMLLDDFGARGGAFSEWLFQAWERTGKIFAEN